jgi:hypothetical protein
MLKSSKFKYNMVAKNIFVCYTKLWFIITHGKGWLLPVAQAAITS